MAETLQLLCGDARITSEGRFSASDLQIHIANQLVSDEVSRDRRSGICLEVSTLPALLAPPVWLYFSARKKSHSLSASSSASADVPKTALRKIANLFFFVRFLLLHRKRRAVQKVLQVAMFTPDVRRQRQQARMPALRCFLSSVPDHRAKAKVLMRSFCVTEVLVRSQPKRRLVAAWLRCISMGSAAPGWPENISKPQWHFCCFQNRGFFV